MVSTKINLSLNEPYVRTVYAKEGDSGRVYEFDIDPTPTENGTLRIKRPDGVEVTADAIIEASGDAYKGDLVTFDALEEVPLTKCEVTLEPVQDLHGLPNPYPSGGYINKFDLAKYFTEGESVTINDVTATYSNGYLRVTGTNSTSTAFNIVSKTISGTLGAGAYGWKGGGHMFVRASVDGGSNTNYQYAITATTSASLVSFFVVVGANASTDWTIPLQIVQSGATTDTYYPYSNICPIVGKDEVSVTRAGYYHRLISTTSYSVGELIDTNNGVSLWYMGAGKYKWQGTASSQSNITVDFEEFTTQPSTVETRKLRINNSQSQNNASVIFRNGTADVDSFSITPINRSISYVTLADKSINRVAFRVNSGNSVDMEIMPEFVDAAEETSYTSVFPTTAKNLFLGEFLQGYWAFANGTWSNSNTWIATPKIRCKPSTYYTASADAKMTRWQGFVWYDENGEYISTDNLQSNANIGLTKQSPSNAKFLVFNIGGYPNSSSTISVEDVTHFQIEEGQTATAYEPHKYEVYGGKVDLVSGKLVVTHKYFSYTSVSLYGDYEGHPLYYMDIANYSTEKVSQYAYKNDVGEIICNYFTPTTSWNMQGMGDCEIRTQESTSPSRFYFRYDNVADLTTLNSMLSTTPLVVVAKLQTPTEVDLTPTQISTLLGTNNIWSSGEVEVAFEYDGLFAELPQQATAVVGRCIGDVDFNGASTMPFTLVVKANNKEQA